jgi:hypothetical protein
VSREKNPVVQVVGPLRADEGLLPNRALSPNSNRIAPMIAKDQPIPFRAPEPIR